MQLPRIKSGRRVDEVAALLRRAIADGQVKVGEHFPSEREMASQLGVGRLVVREAIRSLESAGLIKVKRGINGGCFVREATPDDVSRSFSNLLHMARITLRDLLEVRLGFETGVISTAIHRATLSDLKKIKENVEQTRALAKEGATAQLRDKFDEFHKLLADATHNPLFSLLSLSILDVVNQYMSALHYTSIVSRKTIKEHEAIYQYLAKRDAANAIQSVCEHIKEDNRRFSRRASRENLEYIHYLPQT